jgi:hypothetical protein
MPTFLAKKQKYMSAKDKEVIFVKNPYPFIKNVVKLCKVNFF